MKSSLYQSTVLEDVAEQVALQPWFPDMEYFQLGRGERVARMTSVDLGPVQMAWEHQYAAVQKVGFQSGNRCSICFSSPDPNSRLNEYRNADTEEVFLTPRDTEFDVYIPAGVSTAYISFLDQDQFMNQLRVLDPSRWDESPKAVLALPGRLRPHLETAMDLLLQASQGDAAGNSLPGSEDLQQRVLQELLERIAGSYEGELSHIERVNALHVCRRSLGYVEDRVQQDSLPTITELCQTFGVSERTLQYGFQSYVNMSPHAYLRACRLNRARAALQQPATKKTTVTEVAMRYGFFHMGKFSLSYRAHFGESPSATLARGLRLPASAV
jgi:AraC family ethanolamine operon transcriptional activator